MKSLTEIQWFSDIMWGWEMSSSESLEMSKDCDQDPAKW